ncbi:MAG TPA: LytTR family DNA-binding domain-containing protein [Thermoanaerobaculia bacterium]|nr:LytTR family DNA-binding domain-containing protein [Thermoanaerobaculia bacterium]
MRIAIVEDEAIVARRLERMVAAIVSDCTIRVAPTLAAALELIRATPIDLLFLDLNLGGRDGFTLLEEAAASPFQTVVVSAHSDQALRAFEYGVTDFVAKPWSEERLRTAIERATSREPRNRACTLVVRKGRELRTIATNDVLYARGADDYAELHLGDGTTHLHEKTLAALEALLPSAFARVHRSYIVNFERTRGLRMTPRLALVMEDESLVPIGRVYREVVRERFAAR